MRNGNVVVFIIDDDPSFQDVLKIALQPELEIESAYSHTEAASRLKQKHFDLIVLDLSLPDGNGLTLLDVIKVHQNNCPVVVVTMTNDIRHAISAIRQGAEDYVPKDLGIEEILRVIQRVLESKKRDHELKVLQSEPTPKTQFLYDGSESMTQISSQISQVSGLPVTVLLQGESGTGKEVIAREIHRRGKNPSRPFVSVNLAAVPKDLVESILFGHAKGAFTSAVNPHIGKFELAADGTILLDEIGSMPFELQGKLLRVLQEKEFERVGSNKMLPLRARIIASTHHDLDQAVEQGRFREDLFYRLKVFPIVVPPLRERLEHIEALARHFLFHFLREFGKPIPEVRDDFFDTLRKYSWPGNVRELENLMQRLAVLNQGEIFSALSLPVEFHSVRGNQDYSLRNAIDSYERDLLLSALRLFHGNQRKAAEYLKIPLSTFKFKLRRNRLTEPKETAPKMVVLRSID